MADKKAKKDNKSLIAIICGVVAVIVVVIVIAVALATGGGGNALNDDYFKSDDTKYVLTIETDEEVLNSDDESVAYTPLKTHIVYTYDGDTITGVKTYYEYADGAGAKTAFDAITEAGEDTSSMEVEGKYIIVTAAAEEYEGVNASDVKQQIEFMEMLQSGNFDNYDDVEEVETVEESE